jgi:tetratricopeptide (TPR) repeat protein
MYYSSNELKLKLHAASVVFLIISVVAFQNVTFAGTFSKIAEDYHRQGYEAQLKGDYREALSYYYKAAHVDSDNGSHFNDIGLMYEQIGQPDNAERFYLQAIKADAQYVPPYANLGMLYKREQNLAKAAHFLQKRVELGNPADPWTHKAREELEKLYNSAPLFKEKFIKAEAKRMNLQVSETARQNFKNQMIVANAEYKRGLQLLKSRKTLEAIRAFNASLAFSPQNPKVLQARDDAFRQYRKEQVAERTEQALEMMDQGKEQAAKQQFNEILSIIPNRPK